MNRIQKFSFTLLALALAGAAVPPPTTQMNLLTAYNSEVNASLRYNSFANKAEAEDYPGVAGVFRAVAYSEKIHSENHAAALAELGVRAVESVISYEVKTTEKNLEEAIMIEKNESGKTYPDFIKQASLEKNERAMISLNGAKASEEGHYKLFARLRRSTEEWKHKIEILVCRNCGFATEDKDIRVCPFCGRQGETFSRM